MEENKNTIVTQVVCLHALNSRTQLRSRIQFKYFSQKLPLSQKVRYFRGSCFAQCLKLCFTIACYHVSLLHFKFRNGPFNFVLSCVKFLYHSVQFIVSLLFFVTRIFDLKVHNFGYFFFHYYFATSTTN